MQVGNSADVMPWEQSAETGFDDEMLGWYRSYARLHLRLFPYIGSYAMRLAVDGRAIQRPLGLAYPELGVHPSDTYLLGDNLLVAPVVRYGARTREVTLPAGSWVDWWTGAVHQGTPSGATEVTRITVNAPLGRLPLFLRAGGLVPMLRPTIDTMAPTTEPQRVDSYATSAGMLTVRAAAGASGRFDCFDGATLQMEDTGGVLTLSASSGDEFVEGVLFEVMAVASKPSGVELDQSALGKALDVATLEQLTAAESGWTYENACGGVLWVKLPAGTHEARTQAP